MKRIISSFLAAAAILASVASSAQPALAGGGGLWTDISDKIAERANRPVWAMAYAMPYWYLTDGQELWSGGHVWRTEGSVIADATTDIRNAGLSRVDDIVSDGQTVLFLKNVVNRNSNFEILAYNGGYANWTSKIRSLVNSDEGLVSIAGKGGIWTVVTTKGRVIHWNQATSAYGQFTNQSGNQYLGDSAYSTRHTSPADNFAYIPVAAQPISNGWFVAYRDSNTGYMRFYRQDTSGYSTELTSQIGQTRYLQFIASNGSNVLLATGDSNATYTDHVYLYDGVSFKTVTNYSGSGPAKWNRAIASFDGYHWMVMANKQHYFVDGTLLYASDTEVDYFITLAGNTNGSYLVGGAVSDSSHSDSPSYPLTLKLVRVDLGTSNWSNGYTNNTSNTTGSFGGGMTYSSSAGPNVTTSGNPSNYTINNGETFIYRATASDPNGVNRVSLYVDGSLAKTCYSDTCEYSNVYYSNSLSTRNIPVYAVSMDNQGFTTQTTNEYLKVQGTGSSSNQYGNNALQNSSSGTYYWSYFDPNQTTLQRGNSMTYNVGANDSDGVKRIEMYINGQLKKTCDLGRSYGNQICSQTIYGTDYLSGSSLSVNARILDYLDKETWVPVQTVYVNDNGSYNNNNNGNDISTWTWLDPSGSTLARTSNTTFRVQSSATQGLSLMEVYVNGNLKRTCNFSRVYGTQSCDLTIYGTDYSNGSVLSLNARSTDYNGKTAWSDNKSLTIQDNGSTSNTNGSVGLQATPNQTTFNNGEQVTFTGSSQDNDGLQKIEVLVDGSVVKTCYYSNSTSWESCAYTMNLYSNGGSSRTYNVSTNAYDRYGYSRGVNPIGYTVNGYNGSNNNSSTNPTTWAWSDPNENLTITTNGSATYHVGAWDNDGLKRIEMFVNGISAYTCNLGASVAYGNRECSVTINGSNYSNGNQVYVNAKAVDAYDREGWSTPRTYMIQNSNGTNNNGTTGSTWVWATPDTTAVTNGSNVTFSVGANDPDGIRKIEIIGNGVVFKTCDFGLVYGNQQCSIAVATTYPGTTYASYYGRVTDGTNATLVSETKSFTITNPTTTPTSDNNGTISIWSSRDNGYGPKDTVTFYANGNDSDGIDRIELLVNARLVKTCYGSNTASCSWIGGPYPDRSTVTYAARMVDKAGHSYTAGYKTINKK